MIRNINTDSLSIVDLNVLLSISSTSSTSSLTSFSCVSSSKLSRDDEEDGEDDPIELFDGIEDEETVFEEVIEIMLSFFYTIDFLGPPLFATPEFYLIEKRVDLFEDFDFDFDFLSSLMTASIFETDGI